MDYREIYSSQMFEQSQCIWHENTFVDFIRSLLIQLGYSPVDERRYIWENPQRRIYLAIVDDIEHLNYDSHEDFLSSLTHEHVVITDNWFNRPIAARVLRLPDSWFGIYANRPCIPIPDGWEPKKTWCMPVNRIDYTRMMVVLEMHYRGHINQDCLVNFNCARHGDSVNLQDQQDLWATNWANITPFYQKRYQASYDALTPAMPFRNHDMDLDSMLQSAMVQVVIETYVGDHSVALSEKIFRALTMPRAWRVMSGTWTVARLKSLGFDVMEDVILHDTDHLKMIEDKIPNFVASCHRTWSDLQWSDMEDPCIRARDHNQALLENWRHQWPRDFARWIPEVIDSLI